MVSFFSYLFFGVEGLWSSFFQGKFCFGQSLGHLLLLPSYPQVGKKAPVFAVSGSLLSHDWTDGGSSLRQGGQLDQRDLVLLGDGRPPPALHVLRRGGRRHLPLGSHGRVVPPVPQGPGHRDPGHPPVRLHLLGGPVELHPPATSRHWRSLSLLL